MKKERKRWKEVGEMEQKRGKKGKQRKEREKRSVRGRVGKRQREEKRKEKEEEEQGRYVDTAVKHAWLVLCLWRRVRVGKANTANTADLWRIDAGTRVLCLCGVCGYL